MLSKTRDASVIPPSVLNEDVPEELDEVVIKALALDPADRYQWASQLGDTLQSYLRREGASCNATALGQYMSGAFAAELHEHREFVARLGEAGGRPEDLGDIPVEVADFEVIEEVAQPAPDLEGAPPRSSMSWWEPAAMATDVPEPPRAVTERRSRPRIRQSVKVALKWLELPTKHTGAREALVLDISEGGAQVRSPELLPANAQVELDLRLSPQAQVTLGGQVRWWRRNGTVFDTGIQFNAPSAVLSEALSNIRAREMTATF